MDMHTEAATSTEVAKLIEDTIFWFEDRIETLRSVSEAKEPIVISCEDGEKIPLNDEESRAFKAGVTMAINFIGKFPLSLDRSVNSFEIDNLDTE